LLFINQTFPNKRKDAYSHKGNDVIVRATVIRNVFAAASSPDLHLTDMLQDIPTWSMLTVARLLRVGELTAMMITSRKIHQRMQGSKHIQRRLRLYRRNYQYAALKIDVMEAWPMHHFRRYIAEANVSSNRSTGSLFGDKIRLMLTRLKKMQYWAHRRMLLQETEM
jgi:hypothetical protein